MEYAVPYNPLAGGGHCAQKAEELRAALAPETCALHDLTQLESYAAFFSSLPMGASLVLRGGGGTLSRFVNDTRGLPLPCPVYYCAAGNGNDFLRDIGAPADGRPVRIDLYLRALPEVTVMVYHCASKLKTLRVFTSIFKGEHVRHAEMVDMLTGHDVLVAFDRPAPLQIDGEIIRGVRSYRVHK